MTRLALALLLALAIACAGDRAPEARGRTVALDSAQVDSSMAIIARAASVAIAMDAPDATADSALRAAGMTIADYESLMYRVAADSALTRLFQEAVEKR